MSTGHFQPSINCYFITNLFISPMSSNQSARMGRINKIDIKTISCTVLSTLSCSTPAALSSSRRHTCLSSCAACLPNLRTSYLLEMAQPFVHRRRTYLDVLVNPVQQRALDHHQVLQLLVNVVELVYRLHYVLNLLVALLKVPHCLIFD